MKTSEEIDVFLANQRRLMEVKTEVAQLIEGTSNKLEEEDKMPYFVHDTFVRHITETKLIKPREAEQMIAAIIKENHYRFDGTIFGLYPYTHRCKFCPARYSIILGTCPSCHQ